MEAVRRTIAGKVLSAAAILLAAFVLTLCLAPAKAHAEIYSGSCGADEDNLIWSFDPQTGFLTIEGVGEMMDYYGKVPNQQGDYTATSAAP